MAVWVVQGLFNAIVELLSDLAVGYALFLEIGRTVAVAVHCTCGWAKVRVVFFV